MSMTRSLLIVSMLSCCALPQSSAQNAVGKPGSRSLTTEDIVREMVARNRARFQALVSFEGRRYYTLDYSGFPGKRHAEMVVKASYRAPDTKEFIVVSQSGSGWLVDHVLKRLLESEKEGARDHEGIEINTDNYDFSLLETCTSPAGSCYMLSVQPKTKNKYLYRGKIWVDGTDFAITRIEAEPAANLSFWTKKSEFHHTYAKVGDFWLPVENYSISSLRLGGRAVLTIKFADYHITQASRPSRRLVAATPDVSNQSKR
jgi:outer membrane lipoprotein-sorting protein